MDFGIFMDFYSTRGLTQNEVFKEAFDLVDLAEETGLDSVWLGESHCNPDRSALSAPIVVAGSISARTKPSPPSSIRADCCPERRSSGASNSTCRK